MVCIERAVTSGSSVKRAVMGLLKAIRQLAIKMKSVHAMIAVILKKRLAYFGLLSPIEFPITTVVASYKPTATTNIYPLS